MIFQQLNFNDKGVVKKNLTFVCFGRFLRGNVKKSIFKDIAHIGGREVNPILKKNEKK